jgi:multicomponent Na+:H+ antiporter subunit D
MSLWNGIQDGLVAMPLVIPLLGMGLSLMFWKHPRARQTVGVVASLLLLAVAVSLLRMVPEQGITAMRLGSWASPVGILMEVDTLSALMLTLTAIMALVAVVFSGAGSDPEDRHRPLMPLLMVVLLGVNGAFLTRDLFNLYVWFEVLLMGSFGLLILTGGREGREAAVKSLTLNLIGSLVFLLAVGVTYGLAGTLDMADLQIKLAQVHADRPAAVTATAFLLLMAFAAKAAMFPFHFWLPASYHVPTAGVCALFAALLTKVGVYSILRVMTLPFAVVQGWETVVGLVAGLTMLIGVFGAVTQFDMKRILAWHSISQIGYMAVGLALMAAPAPEVRLAGVTATIFFVLHHGLVKPALFLIAGLVENLSGSTNLKKTGGLYLAKPILAVVFLLAALSLAGIPPLSGFWAKLAVIQASVSAGAGWLVAAALGAGLLTLLSMVKIWNEVFWKPASGAPLPTSRRVGRAGWVATFALVLLITVIGLQPRLLFDLSENAAAQVLADRARIVGTLEVGP